MNRTLATLLSLVTALCGCAPMAIPYPDIDRSLATESVIVGRLIRADYHQQLPECLAHEVGDIINVCTDPPPLRLEVGVESTIFGPPVASRLFAGTTSHYGRRTYSYGNDNLYLMHVYQQDGKTEIPRYEIELLAFDGRGQVALPIVKPSNIPSWLPCDTTTLIEPYTFVAPRNAFLVSSDYITAEDAAQYPEYWSSHSSKLRIRGGVSIKDLRRYLREYEGRTLPDCGDP